MLIFFFLIFALIGILAYDFGKSHFNKPYYAVTDEEVEVQYDYLKKVESLSVVEVKENKSYSGAYEGRIFRG